MTDDALRLADYRPRSSLRVASHEVRRPRFPVVDAHNHLGSAFGGEWARRDPAELIATLDEAGIEMLVDLDGGQGEALSAEIERWQAAYPDRVAVFAGLDYDAWRERSRVRRDRGRAAPRLRGPRGARG